MSHATWILLTKDTQHVLSVACLVLFISSLAVSMALSLAVLAVRVFPRGSMPALNTTWLISIAEVGLSGMALLLVSVLPVVLADVWSITCVVLMIELIVLRLWYRLGGMEGNPRWMEARKRLFLLESLVILVLLIASALIAFLPAL